MVNNRKKGPETEEKYVTPEIAAELLDVGATTVRVWLRSGILSRSKKIRGTRWRVSMRDIKDILDGKISVEGAYNGFQKKYREKLRKVSKQNN